MIPHDDRIFSTENFKYEFKKYTVTNVDGVLTGVFTQVTNDSDLCPKGRILRENGRKLYPGANPNVNQYYVGVYDAISFLNGFIDPNSYLFAIFNTDKPVYLEDNYSDDDTDDNSQGPDLGNPVYTNGNIETRAGNILAGAQAVDLGNARIAVENDNGRYAGLYLTNDGEYPNVETGYSTNYAGMYGDDGSIYNSGLINPFNAKGSATLNGASPSLVTVTNNLLLQNPLVFLTRNGAAGNGNLYYTVNSNVLTIRSGDGDTTNINWLLIGTSS